MPPLFMLDLFAGRGGASAAMKAREWSVTTVDADPSHGCDITADLSAWSWDGPTPDLVWASPPCTEFSRSHLPWLRGKYPAPSLALLNAAVRVINETQPRWWVIENVRGAIRWFKPIIGPVVCQVGQAFLWGRFPDIGRVRVPAHKQRLSSRRRAERSMIPAPISLALARACESSLFAEVRL